MSTEAWSVVSTQQSGTGEYVRLNLVGKGNVGAVTVKDRKNLPGERFVCLTCHSNDCAHVRFVRKAAA